MIEIHHLSKAFGPSTVLDDVSFSVAAGEIFGIVGHSGAGKSTLLRCLNGLEHHDRGTLRVMGADVGALDEAGLRTLRQQMGMVFQNFNLMRRKTVAENVAFPMEIWGAPRKSIENRVEELLELVGLSAKRHERIACLSGGQKQRVGIARTLALAPQILLCDEATSALDPKTTLAILELLTDINRRLGVTIVLVTHQMDVVKMICHRVAFLDAGRVAAVGATETVFLDPPKELRRFLQDDEAPLPPGTNIRLRFPREIAQESVITTMARELDLDFSVVGGRLERYREHVLGFLVIHVSPENRERVCRYLEDKKLFWEVLDHGQ